MKTKTYHDVKGWQANCLNYEKCPLCYGCRSYNSAHLTCAKCAENTKQNICNTQKHRSELLSRMILREVIVVATGKSA